ncbi:MAG: hypothetical protein GX214_03980 [Clostridiales bacterium]|nr:hypothetical protein [Clostridiales bacterium]
MKRFMSFLLILCLVVSSAVMVFGQAPSDIHNHWAERVIEDWVGDGLIRGYPDGSFRPDNPISRAEFMVLVNKAYGFTERAEIDFTDVSASDWYYNAIATAVGAGYISGYPDASMQPNSPISRQEVTVVLSKINDLVKDPVATTEFVDMDKIASWAKGYVGAVVKEGYMGGYPDRTFKGENNITRAEAVVTLNKAMTPVVEEEPKEEDLVYDKPGVYGDKYVLTTINGDVTVEAEDITLQNLVIKGDLIIAEEVGKGNVYLNDVTVEGKTYVRGGGTDSIYINGGKFNQIIVEKTSSGDVRIVATNTKGAEIVIVDAAKGQTLTLDGEFKTVTIEADNYKLVTKGDTKIDKIVVKEKVKAAKLDLSKNTVIDRLVADSKVETKGDGKIKLAEGKEVKDSTFATKPDTIKIPSAGGGGGGGSTPSKIQLTVDDIKMIVDDKEYETSELKGLESNARVQGIKFTVNADESTLKINKIVSEGMTAITDRTVKFETKNAYVGVDTLLGTDQKSVSLGTLRGTFGNKVTVEGELSAINYESYTQSFVIELGEKDAAEYTKNDWADVKVQDKTITATIKSGQENVEVSKIGIATFINTTFKQLPEKVRITGDWIAVGDSGSYEKIQNQIAGSKSWNNLTLSDLRGKTFDFKAFNNETVYTLKIQ